MIAPLSELDEEALIQILLNRKCTDQTISSIIWLRRCGTWIHARSIKSNGEKALERKTGARGLRSIVEAVLLDTMYDLPSIENLQKVIVDEETIVDNKPPKLEYKNNRKCGCFF